MGNSIEDKDLSGSNESLSKFIGNAKITAKIMDKGKEFYSKSMKELLEKNNVQLYSTENEEKSTIVKRWNRTIKRNVETFQCKQYNEVHQHSPKFKKEIQ